LAEFAETIVKAMEAGQPVVVATLVGPEDLASGLLGRKVVVADRSVVSGSIGLDTLDRRVADEAWKALQDRKGARLFCVSLTAEEAQLLDLKPGIELRLFIDPLLPPPALLIVGAGHIAQPLSRMGKMLGFLVTVIDDRSDFANRERFPEADRVVCGAYDKELRDFPITRSTYIVIVTRGHVHDELALKTVIASEAAYIGMIGSQRRVRGVFSRLRDSGVTEGRLARVYSPIGLDIGAETPAEIAVSILAEVINVMRRGEGHPSSLSALKKRVG